MRRLRQGMPSPTGRRPTCGGVMGRTRTGRARGATTMLLDARIIHTYAEKTTTTRERLLFPDTVCYELMRQRAGMIARGQSPRLLVVEDDPAISELVRECLEAEGYAVVTADSMEQAVAALMERQFDLVLADVIG